MPSNKTDKELRTSEEAPLNEANESDELQKDPPRNFVYDFLYHDVRRISSFLSQFETYGVPQQVKAGEISGHTGANKTGGSASVEIPLLAKGQAGRDHTSTHEERDTLERTYDPLWTNAITFLDYLEEHNLTQRDVWKARIGQFVLIKGILVILDIAMMKAAWGKQSVQNLLIAQRISKISTEGSREDRRRRSRKLGPRQ